MPGGWRSIGWFPVLLFTEHGTGADTGVKCFFHHMYGPAIDSCSDRIVRSDGKGLKRFHIRIYCRSVGCGLADIQRKFHSPDITLGDLLTLLASLSWAFYSLVIRSLTRKYSPAFITRKIFFYGIITILPTFLFLPSLTKPAVLLDSEVWSNLLFLGVIASSACYLLWNIVVKQLGTIQASNYLYLNPLATTVGATIFLHEEVTPVAIGGIVLVLSGVYLATRNSRPQNSTAIKKQAD